jgi:DUF4097 and DUF4098 domain-containing protein YvlB
MTSWEQTYHLPAGGRLQIEQRSGAVGITGWDQSTVQLIATTSREEAIEERLTASQDSRGLTLEVHPPRGRFLGFIGFSDEAVDLDLRVPFGTPCEIETGSGPISVTATRASLRIESGSGAVSVQEAQGTVAVESGSGKIYLGQISGDVRVELGSGSVHAEQIAGRGLSVETGSGEVRLAKLAVERLDVNSGSGRVHAELESVYAHGVYRLETSSGGAIVGVPADAGLQVSVETGSGHISCPGLGLRVLQSEPGELRGILNEGGARLVVEASSGNVEILPLQVPAQAPDQLQRVLAMVAEGRLTPDEAEEILSALDEEVRPV